MDVLVTGGAGFIGSHLVDRLLEGGDRVVVIDDFNDFYDPAIKRENLEGASTSERFRLYEGDIRDRGLVRRLFDENRIDCVCHIAARAGVRPSLEDPLLYEEVNCVGTLNLLEEVKTRELKNFVFASSSSVYGINSKVPFSEDDPITQPISPYAVTKRANELMLFSYAHLYNIPTTCLRFFTVYGERGRPEMAVGNFTRRIAEGREINVFGDGSARRDFTYIGDILQGVVAAIERSTPFEIINLGESRVVEVRYLISLIEENLKKRAKIRYHPPSPGDVPLTYADIGKARRLLDYDPKVAIEEGIERYVNWLLQRSGR
ncbi:MAG: GDP-mannose 4,6-dehydratase [Thermodesulfobacteriota bacterium]